MLEVIQYFGEFTRLQLVRFCEGDDKGNAVIKQPLHHHGVVVCRADARINQLYDKAETVSQRVSCEVAVRQRRENLSFFSRSPCIAIPGQINEKQFFVYVIKVNGDCFSRGSADACKALPAKQAVDERGLADIGAPRKGNLRNSVFGELIGSAGADA